MTDQAEEWEAITQKVQSNSDHLNQIDQNIKNLKDISDLLDVNVEQLTSDSQSTEENLEVVAKILEYLVEKSKNHDEQFNQILELFGHSTDVQKQIVGAIRGLTEGPVMGRNLSDSG